MIILTFSCGVRNNNRNHDESISALKVEEKNIALTTETLNEYQGLKGLVLKNIINKIDFNEINLEKSYSITGKSKEEEYKILEEGEDVCKVEFELEKHVVYTEDQVNVLTLKLNKKELSQKKCTESHLKNEGELNIFKLSSKSSFKNDLINAYSSVVTPQEKNYFKTIQLASFVVQKEGVEIFYLNSDSQKFSSLKATNPDYIWNDDLKNIQNLKDYESSLIDKSLVLNSICTWDLPYLGSMSEIKNDSDLANAKCEKNEEIKKYL